MFVSEIALNGLTYFLFAGVYSMLAAKNIPVGSFKTLPLQVPGFTSPLQTTGGSGKLYFRPIFGSSQ